MRIVQQKFVCTTSFLRLPPSASRTAPPWLFASRSRVIFPVTSLVGYTAGMAWEELDGLFRAEETPLEKLNIIVIMNEAFSDPLPLPDFQTNEDYMPLHAQSDGRSRQYHIRLADRFWCRIPLNMEFEYLTGTHGFLPLLKHTYQQYITGETPSMAGSTSPRWVIRPEAMYL